MPMCRKRSNSSVPRKSSLNLSKKALLRVEALQSSPQVPSIPKHYPNPLHSPHEKARRGKSMSKQIQEKILTHLKSDTYRPQKRRHLAKQLQMADDERY